MSGLNGIRSAFLDFFASRSHKIAPSSALVPQNDPTLLFTNAGMVQFKNYFTGAEAPPFPRAVTSQKCVRAGGKHNDLDNVGYTARHHTFFEMLGNFSFGDYFKEDAIEFSWSLVTKEFSLPKDRLLVTVYHDDDAAVDLWRKIAGLPDDRIIRISTSDNFWSMGPVGPCGPCSEIFYDHGPEIEGGPPGSPDEDGDRFIEIWNLVFMQFEQFEDGRREALPKPSIDTGMGLERIGAILQGKHDNYDTDVMRALIEASAQATNADPDGPGQTHHRVIADHLRSTGFLIADGVLPSNEGRGYVLRRIMRRAMRHAHLLGAQEPVMWRLPPALIAEMGQAFPELSRAQALIEETLKLEETRFRSMLDRGLALLDDALASLGESEDLPGDVAFKLYDTYGFPLDLTQDALRERGRSVDEAGFTSAMEAQKTRARAAWSGSGDVGTDALWLEIAEETEPTEFLGYSQLTAQARVEAIVKSGERVESVSTAEEVQIVFNQTPCYAESGGQIGDLGSAASAGAALRITDVRKRAGGLFAHSATIEAGRLSVGDVVELIVDFSHRLRVQSNHSATHLLHEALRGGLGDHVAQRGSLVAAERLRFDFTHGRALTSSEISAIEREVNGYVRQNAPVSTRLMTPDEAQGIGARALFGEKYGDEVRVVSMGVRPAGESGPAGSVYSLELCGGTHVARTGEIGLFKIVGEAASSSGVRRVEALTGAAALDYVSEQAAGLRSAAAILKASPEDVPDRLTALMDERRALTNEVAELRRRVALGEGDPTMAAPQSIEGVPFLAQTLKDVSAKDLRGLIDAQKARLGTGVVALVADVGDKAAVAVGVTEDLTDRLSAVDCVKRAASALGGKGGGGRPDMAQAGGADPSKAEEAIAEIEAAIREALGGG